MSATNNQKAGSGYVDLYAAVAQEFGFSTRKTTDVIQKYRRLLAPIRRQKLCIRPCKLALLRDALESERPSRRGRKKAPK
jgi:hypothetical protein